MIQHTNTLRQLIKASIYTGVNKTYDNYNEGEQSQPFGT